MHTLLADRIDTMRVPWMLIRLALETHAHHAEADDDRLAAMDITTRAAYRAFLVRVYGFEAAVEAAVWRVADLDPNVLHDRQKMDRLREDLEALGVLTGQLANLETATVKVHSAGHALGWLFVIERHTLLAGLIRRHIHRSVGDMLGGAFAYLSAYGDTPGARFRALGEALCHHAEQHSATAIVAGANDAFRAQRLWYRSRREDPTRPSKPRSQDAEPAVELTHP